MLPHEVDDSTKRRELLERTRKELELNAEKPLEALKMIDIIQRLGLSYHFEDDINSILTGFSNISSQTHEDLLTASLCFRLLRHNGHKINPGTNPTPFFFFFFLIVCEKKNIFILNRAYMIIFQKYFFPE